MVGFVAWGFVGRGRGRFGKCWGWMMIFLDYGDGATQAAWRGERRRVRMCGWCGRYVAVVCSGEPEGEGGEEGRLHDDQKTFGHAENVCGVLTETRREEKRRRR